MNMNIFTILFFVDLNIIAIAIGWGIYKVATKQLSLKKPALTFSLALIPLLPIYIKMHQPAPSTPSTSTENSQ